MSRVQVKLIHACYVPGGRYAQPGDIVSLSVNQARAFVSSGRAMQLKVSPPTQRQPAPAAPPPPDLYSCFHCDKEYKTESGLSNHVATKHGEDD